MGLVAKIKAVSSGEVDLPSWVMTGLLTSAVVLVCCLGGCTWDQEGQAHLKQPYVDYSGQMRDSNGNKIYPSLEYSEKEGEDLSE